MKELKFTSHESVQSFINDLSTTPTPELIDDPYVTAFMTRGALQARNPLKIAESLLCLFEEREEYEMCNRITRAYPELAVSNKAVHCYN
jgi:hypothetical protein